MKKISLIFAVFFVFLAEVCNAHDLATDLGIAMFNVPQGADIAGMGNADAAAWNGFSSNNPAAIAFELPGNTCKNAGAINWGTINFKNGPTIDFYALSGTRKFGQDFITVTGTYFASDTGTMKDGFESRFRPCRNLDITWARKINENLFFSKDELYFGANAEMGKSEMNFYYRDWRNKRKTAIQSKSDSMGGTVGLLYKINKVHFGVYWNRVWEKSKERDVVFKKKETYRSHSDKFRLGASWQILEGTFIAGDYQFLNIDGTKEHQFFTGVEQKVIDPVYLYAGIANHNPTCGIGIYFPRGGFNLAFAKMDEMKKHFGTGKLVTALFFFSF